MQKPKSFRPWQPDQTTLLPPSPREWLAEDHQVYFLLDLVDELDLSEILIPAQAKDPRGEKGFDPRMMTMLLLCSTPTAWARCRPARSNAPATRTSRSGCLQAISNRTTAGSAISGAATWTPSRACSFRSGVPPISWTPFRGSHG